MAVKQSSNSREQRDLPRREILKIMGPRMGKVCAGRAMDTLLGLTGEPPVTPQQLWSVALLLELKGRES